MNIYFEVIWMTPLQAGLVGDVAPLSRHGDLFQIKFRRAVWTVPKLDGLAKELFRLVQSAIGVILHGGLEGCDPRAFFRRGRIHSEHFVNNHSLAFPRQLKTSE